MQKENDTTNRRSFYPWKSFLVFTFLFLIGLASYYPSLLAQVEVYLEILGETYAYTVAQLAGFSLIQPFLIGVIAIYFGTRYIKQVNLRSLIMEQVGDMKNTTDKNWLNALKESLPFIVVFASVTALLHLSFDFIFQNWLPEALQPSYLIPNGQQLLSNLLYSGLGEEIMLRYGIMTSVIYVFSSRGKELDRWVYILGIVFTSIAFGIAQYNSNFATFGYSFILILRLALLAGLEGILFGSLYYKFHVEAAMLSHVLANLLFIGGNILVVWIAG